MSGCDTEQVPRLLLLLFILDNATFRAKRMQTTERLNRNIKAINCSLLPDNVIFIHHRVLFCCRPTFQQVGPNTIELFYFALCHHFNYQINIQINKQDSHFCLIFTGGRPACLIWIIQSYRKPPVPMKTVSAVDV